jgi:hypothetical protein
MADGLHLRVVAEFVKICQQVTGSIPGQVIPCSRFFFCPSMEEDIDLHPLFMGKALT